MAPSFVTIDTGDSDFDMAPAPRSFDTVTSRTLLLAPPSIATQEDKLRALFTTHPRATTDLQMLDRLSAGFVTLPTNTYDLVLVVTDSDGSHRAEALKLLTRDVYTALVPAMKAGAKLQAQDKALDASEAMEAILAGLVQTGSGFEKPNFEQATAIPLKFGLNRKKKTTTPAPAPPVGLPVTGFTANDINGNNHDRDDDDDELINEDSLIDEEDFTRPIMPRMFHIYIYLSIIVMSTNDFLSPRVSA
jgi:hypothetical protein